MKLRTPHSRRGFTLLELLVVIGLIAFLVASLTMVIGGVLGTAREAATSATIMKINGPLQQRVQAFGVEIKKLKDTGRMEVLIERKRAELEGRTSGGGPRLGTIALPQRVFLDKDEPVLEILAVKELYRDAFPQRFAESPDRNGNGQPDIVDRILTVLGSSVDPAKHTKDTESSELMYFALTQSSAFGPPIDPDQFTSSEIRDTDSDGLLEFVDAWGRPLQFYRWPTRLIDPIRDGIIRAEERQVAGYLIYGLPAYASPDPLTFDPDDPAGQLQVLGQFAVSGAIVHPLRVEAAFHSANIWHLPLIVSAGADAELGLYEPHILEDTDSNGLYDRFGTLAQPLATVVWREDDSAAPGGFWVRTNPDPLLDNITNRQQRAGARR